ncbi:prolyl oligopeptidase family protein [Novosphingobium tardum]|uniref:prolyl oligopeptidase n=1 Tax=Novosphingobium tardum TaxID=1538021 RepID=A0ABV8RT51_9SPHN
MSLRHLRRLLVAIWLVALSGAAAASDPPARLKLSDYPQSRRESVVETRFGQRVPDPYRWLERDARRDPAVAAWVEQQNDLSSAYLRSLPGREHFAARIRAILNYERFGIPRKAGRLYFYLHNTGLQSQSSLLVRRGLSGKPRTLLDPEGWSPGGTTALDAWEPSRDGALLAYSVQEMGSDWRTVRFLDVDSGRMLEDQLSWVKFSGLAWVGTKGILYSRFPGEGDQFDRTLPSFGQAIWFHRIGTPQFADRLVYSTPDHPEYGHSATVTTDGRYAVITSGMGKIARHEIRVIDLAEPDPAKWVVRPLVTGFNDDWTFVDGLGRNLWLRTNSGAPRYRLVRVELGESEMRWTEVIPQTTSVLAGANVVGNRLLLSYLDNAATRALVTDFSGRAVRGIALNVIGSAAGFEGRPGDPETFYQFSSYAQPPAVYRLDLDTGRIRAFSAPQFAFDPAAYVVEQRFYPSRDGTRVPLFLVRSRALATSGRAAPTILYGYGGFDVSLTPGFSAVRMAWIEAGGAFAVAGVRGGGEYGSEWHDAGRLANKQNAFDDFIAAGEYLVSQGITPAGGLALQGSSNGGMMVAAVMNQRPDLFAAANPDVGVMDMLRFDRFGAGRYWYEDYGHPDRQPDFEWLRAYSPYHNIRKGDYPAILVTAADSDDRVVPAHSFKYVAALQAADLGAKPRILRVEANAGHGPGRPTEMVIASGADVLAFLAFWTGLHVSN